jgi:hypothetical protein
MAQIGGPHVEAALGEIVGAPAARPQPVAGERAVHQEDGGPAVAVGAEPVERQLDAVVGQDASLVHAYIPAAR